MSKDEAILRYKASMSVFKKWLTDGAVTESDLLAIDSMLAKKYGLSSCSIYLEYDLLCREKGVMNGTAKGE